jgi:hypothetical protein
VPGSGVLLLLPALACMLCWLHLHTRDTGFWLKRRYMEACMDFTPGAVVRSALHLALMHQQQQ